jgi:hypothetical protein
MKKKTPPTYTYTPGPWFDVPEKGLSKNDFHTTLTLLHALFGSEYTFRYEPVSEGGFEMIRWPGKKIGEGYKTIRFGENSEAGTWPYIDGTELWQGMSYIVFKGPFRLNTFLKAYRGAPCWTKEEVDKVCQAFGLKASFPKDFVKSLRKEGET